MTSHPAKERKSLARVEKALQGLPGNFVLLYSPNTTKEVHAFASPGGAEFLYVTDAGNTFAAVMQLAEVEVRMLELRVSSGELDCSYAALGEGLRGAMLAAILAGLVDLQTYPFASTSTERFREVRLDIFPC